MTPKLDLISVAHVSVIFCMMVFMGVRSIYKTELINISHYLHVGVGCRGEPLSCQPNNV